MKALLSTLPQAGPGGAVFSERPAMGRIGVLWAQYGPYHFARFAALARLAGIDRVHALEIANHTRDYHWAREASRCELVTLCPGRVTEELPFRLVFQNARRKLSALRIDVCLLPSYSPRQSAAALFAAKSLGIRTVMMNESHAGTTQATGAFAIAKRRLVNLFDAALVGGVPHRRYFASLGLPMEKIFTGYDAVDNDYFSRSADIVRQHEALHRRRHELPEHFVLSLGRFVPKKNLSRLIWAYRIFLDASPFRRTHLVLVGAGDEEKSLRALAAELHLPIYDKTGVAWANRRAGNDNHADLEDDEPTRIETLTAKRNKDSAPGVHFYGFRQIDENPIFYGLADAFVLPSVAEEWGLVVNEAMASGLPVVVSEAAGCAEDLLERGLPAVPEAGSAPLLERLSRLKVGICRNGFLFEPGSAESLAGVMLALEAMPELRAAMGRASRRIVEQFSCKNFAENALRAVRAASNAAAPAPARGSDEIPAC